MLAPPIKSVIELVFYQGQVICLSILRWRSLYLQVFCLVFLSCLPMNLTSCVNVDHATAPRSICVWYVFLAPSLHETRLLDLPSYLPCSTPVLILSSTSVPYSVTRSYIRICQCSLTHWNIILLDFKAKEKSSPVKFIKILLYSLIERVPKNLFVD